MRFVIYYVGVVRACNVWGQRSSHCCVGIFGGRSSQGNAQKRASKIVWIKEVLD